MTQQPLSQLPAWLSDKARKDGDVFDATPANDVLVLTGELPHIKKNRLKINLNGGTLREQLHALPPAPIVSQRIKAMAAMTPPLTGDYRDLTPAQKASVNAALPADASDVIALVKALISGIAPYSAGRLFGAALQNAGQIVYNGLTYTFGIGWGANISKGIMTIDAGVYGTEIYEGVFQNARMGGSSYNAAGIRSQGYDHFVARCRFEDCENGILAGGSSFSPDAAGEWLQQIMPTAPATGRMSKYGQHIDVDCTYDDNGAGGNAHNVYYGEAILNLSVNPKVIRTNGGNALKYHGGAINLVVNPAVVDLRDSGGELQAVDFDSGYCAVVNGDLMKDTAGTGNYGATIMMRNERDPQPVWFENRIMVKGSRVANDLAHNSWYFRVIDAARYYGDGKGGGIWPGVPMPTTGTFDHCLTLSRKGEAVDKTPYVLVPGVTIGNVTHWDLADLAIAPDVSIKLRNYVWTPQTALANALDIIHLIDGVRPWEAKLLSLPMYPAGITAPPAASNGSASDQQPSPQQPAAGGDAQPTTDGGAQTPAPAPAPVETPPASDVPSAGTPSVPAPFSGLVSYRYVNGVVMDVTVAPELAAVSSP